MVSGAGDEEHLPRRRAAIHSARLRSAGRWTLFACPRRVQPAGVSVAAVEMIVNDLAPRVSAT